MGDAEARTANTPTRASTDCGLCALVRDRQAATRIAAFEHSIAVVSQHQRFAGKSLLIFKHHVEDILELPVPVHRAFAEELRRLARALRAAYRPGRINYVNNGNVMPHVHWHLIPRYPDDGFWGGPVPQPEIRNPPLDDAVYRQIAARIRAAL